MDYSTYTDETLIRLIAEAQPEALAELYERYKRLVFSLVFNIVSDQAEAEEITLDVFVTIWEKAELYRTDLARVSTWLTSIARNRAIDRLRRRNLHPDQQPINWADVLSHALPGEGDPAAIAERRMQQERVRAAIDQLPTDQQQALALAYFRGYTHQQISDMLKQPLGTIKTRIRLAMQKLRRILQDEQISTR
jgi:RNA polymerase sigma-70 factor (ECF subfamily)